MMGKRFRVQCCSCNRHFLVRYGEGSPAATERPYLCPACAAPRGRDSRMILIEVKEHQHLLSLYQAVYFAASSPTFENLEESRIALEDCNRFFAGELSCR